MKTRKHAKPWEKNEKDKTLNSLSLHTCKQYEREEKKIKEREKQKEQNNILISRSNI